MKVEDVDNEHVIDVRGKKSPAPKVAAGGLALAIVGILVSRLLGVDVTGLFGGGGGGQTTGNAPPSADKGPGEAAPLDGPDAHAEEKRLVKYVLKDVQETFDAMFKAEHRDYKFANLYIFSDATDTACGHASKDIGPFYCPGDSNAYIDLSFYDELKKRFGAPGNFAQAYVIAHEIGHHLQNLIRLEGKEPKPRGGESKNQYSVRVELQADCFAGVWAKHAQGKGLLEAGDVEKALTAAAAIGDDRLQKQAGMEVHPESFTHGTSEQRMKWFRAGMDSGAFSACDTFSPPTP